MQGKVRGKENEKRILKVLDDLYDLTSDGYRSLNVKDFELNHKIGSRIRCQIFNNLLDRKQDKTRPGNCFKYKWRTIKPNIYMARKICEEARKEANNFKSNVPDLFTYNKKEYKALMPSDNVYIESIKLLMEKQSLSFDEVLKIMISNITDKVAKSRMKKKLTELYNKHIKVDNIGSETFEINKGKAVKKNTNRNKNKTISIFWGLVKINVNK